MCLVEVVDGRVAKGDKLVAMSSGECWEVGELGLLAPEPTPTGELLTGQVGQAAGGSVRRCASLQRCNREPAAGTGGGVVDPV